MEELSRFIQKKGLKYTTTYNICVKLRFQPLLVELVLVLNIGEVAEERNRRSEKKKMNLDNINHQD